MRQGEARDRLLRALSITKPIIGRMSPEALLRAAGYVRTEDIAGAYEVADVIGVSRNVVCQWTRRAVGDWPGPVTHLAQGAIYDLAAIRSADRANPERER